MESDAYIRNETWPPQYQLDEKAETAFERIYNRTKEQFLGEFPEHARKIEKTTSEDLFFGFWPDQRVVFRHAMILRRKEKKDIKLVAPKAFTNDALQAIPPHDRVHLARWMVWAHIFRIMDEEWNQPGTAEVDVDVDEAEGEWDDVGELKIPFDDPDHVRIANQDPLLRELFQKVILGNISRE